MISREQNGLILRKRMGHLHETIAHLGAGEVYYQYNDELMRSLAWCLTPELTEAAFRLIAEEV